MRRSITLIEVVVALALMSVLMTMIMGTYRHLAARNKKMRDASYEVCQRDFIRKKLQSLFFGISEGGDSFYLGQNGEGNPTLYFSYENGIDPDPSFSGQIDAQLYKDNRELILQSTSQNEKVKTEILAQNIGELQFFFFDRNNSKGPIWATEWNDSHSELPPFVKIVIDGIPYAFPFPPSLSAVESS